MLGPRSDKNRMSQYIPVYTPVGFHQVFIVTIPMLGSERGGKVHIYATNSISALVTTVTHRAESKFSRLSFNKRSKNHSSLIVSRILH